MPMLGGGGEGDGRAGGGGGRADDGRRDGRHISFTIPDYGIRVGPSRIAISSLTQMVDSGFSQSSQTSI